LVQIQPPQPIQEVDSQRVAPERATLSFFFRRPVVRVLSGFPKT
jgi:hypothetical protein